VVVDTSVEPDLSQGEVIIDLPLFSEGRDRAMFMISSDRFSELLKDKNPQRIVFAGRLESFDQLGEENRIWQFRFDEASLFLWSAPETLEMVGFTIDEATTETLQAQAELAEVSP